MYDPKEDKPDFKDGYGINVGEQISFSPMGYYHLIIEDLSPKQLYKVFNTGDSRELKRIEDVEMAIKFINDTLNVDSFTSPHSDEHDVESLLMKGYLLERIRFRILREDWEPVFDPFPREPLKYTDPDVVVEKRSDSDKVSMWIKIRNHTDSNYVTMHIHSPSESSDKFWLTDIDTGKRFESEYIAELLDEYHEYLEESKNHPDEYVDEVGKKLIDVLAEYRQIDIDEEQAVRIDGVIGN